jgi:hypothetical protein
MTRLEPGRQNLLTMRQKIRTAGFYRFDVGAFDPIERSDKEGMDFANFFWSYYLFTNSIEHNGYIRARPHEGRLASL